MKHRHTWKFAGSYITMWKEYPETKECGIIVESCSCGLWGARSYLDGEAKSKKNRVLITETRAKEIRGYEELS